MTPAETVIFWVECFIKYWLYLRRLIENHQNPLWIFNSLGQKTFQTKNKSFHKMFLLVKLKRKKKHIKTAYLVKNNGEKNKGWKIKKLVDFIYQCKKKGTTGFLTMKYLSKNQFISFCEYVQAKCNGTALQYSNASVATNLAIRLMMVNWRTKIVLDQKLF